MKKFLILFRHGFGFQKAQLIFWAQTQPVVATHSIQKFILFFQKKKQDIFF